LFGGCSLDSRCIVKMYCEDTGRRIGGLDFFDETAEPSACNAHSDKEELAGTGR